MSDECAMAEGRERERADVLALLDGEIDRVLQWADKSPGLVSAAVLQRVRAMIAHGIHVGLRK